jgi:putative toxin-antitoxin system antitoxin component (TIGR02293 family)
MAQAQSVGVLLERHLPGKRQRSMAGGEQAILPGTGKNPASVDSLYFESHQGMGKAVAALLFRRVAAASAQPWGQLRALLIPDSSWKRAGKTLGPQASQTAARLKHILSFAESVWGNEADAVQWLNQPHTELRGATPYSLLKTEAGGRAVEALLAALEFGFPV